MGTNRSFAKIHALLHLSPKPLPADKIAETLKIARSNVSTGLKELQGWKLVNGERQLGDRRKGEYAPTRPAFPCSAALQRPNARTLSIRSPSSLR